MKTVESTRLISYNMLLFVRARAILEMSFGRMNV